MKTGTYCHLELDQKSKDRLRLFSKYFKNCLPSDVLHCTIICDENVSFNLNKQVRINSKIIDIKCWSYEDNGILKNNIVLILDNSLKNLNLKLEKQYGAKHYIQPFVPHITISYNGEINHIPHYIKNKIIGTKLKFINIKSKMNNPNWKDDYNK